MMDVDIAADKAAPQQQQQQQQHVWSSAATAYEALALVLAALEDPSSSSSLTRSSLAALHATLHSAADAYLSHLVPPTSSRHQRLIHERSRFHVSRTQMTNTLAQGFQLPLRGSKDIGPSAVTSSTTAAATAPASGPVSKSSDQVTIPRALSQQLYSALNQLHPSRPAQPPDPDPPASTTAAATAAADTISSAAPPSNLSLPINSTPPAPSPRTSPALATLALTSLSNILTAPARSLFSFEVFAEHFDLDRASAGGTGGAAGAASPAGGGVTSPSVAVSPAVMPPETADGGRAVSVIMIGGTVLVVDIEVGIKDVQQLGGAAATAAQQQQQQQQQEGAAWLPAWAKEKGQLSWLPSVHVKITFATDTSSSSSSSLSAVKTEVANGQAETESGPAHTSDPAALAKLLQRHIEVLAELLLLGFPLNLELDPRRQSSSTANDDDVLMSDAADVQPTPVESQPASTNSSTRHEKSSNLLHTALRSEANARTRTPQQLDPSLRKTHMGLYGEEYYLLAHHHLQAFILLLARLAQLDKERAGAGSAVASAA